MEMHMENRSVRTLKLIGGRLCLDFTNTLGMHASEQSPEFLRSYFDLVEWSNYTGIITGGEKRLLLHKAEDNPAEAARALQHAQELRENIFRVFLAIAKKTPPPEKEVANLNKAFTQMMRHSRFDFKESGASWDVKKGSGETLDGMLNTVVQSAFKLLTSNELDRVKICADERGCGWLFFDHSKNKSRRWCDMRECGNLAKQKRFYNRKHKQATK